MNKKSGLIVFVIVAVVAAVSVGLVSGDNGKIPITTKSDKALEQFLKGRDMADKLRNLEAREYYLNAVKADPEFALAQMNLALVSASASEFFEAMEKAVALADKVSDGERLWIQGFEAGAVNGDPVAQLKDYNKLVGMYPNDERAHNLLGGYYFGTQEFQKAIDSYERAVAINPDFSQPYNQLGYAYRFLADYENAEKAFKKYTEILPDDPNPYDSYAELLMKMGRFDESIAKYHQALEIQTNFVFSYLGIASCLTYQGKHEEAYKEADKMFEAAAHDGQRRAALTVKSACYLDAGNYEMAFGAIDERFKYAEAIGDSSNMAADLNQMAMIHLLEGHIDSAEKMFGLGLEYVLKSSLDDDVKELAKLGNLYNLSRVAIARGDFESAREKTAKYSEHANKVNNPFQIRLAHELAGLIAAAEGNQLKAIEEFEQANLQNPANLYRIGLAYEASGDKEEAGNWFEKAATYYQPIFQQYASVRAKAAQKAMSM